MSGFLQVELLFNYTEKKLVRWEDVGIAWRPLLVHPHLSPHQSPWGLSVPLFGDQRLRPQSSGLGFCRARKANHHIGSTEQGLFESADQQGVPAASDPPCRHRQRHACHHARLPVEGLRVLRSFSRLRVSNDNHYAESLIRTSKYRPDSPRRLIVSKVDACQWEVAFLK